MDTKTLRRMNEDELAAYLWRRLRLDPPLDPPLDRRFRLEPPEDILIKAFEEKQNKAFKRRIGNAIKDNLQKLILEAQNRPISNVSSDQLASMGFLATEIGASELAHPFYGFCTANQVGRNKRYLFNETALFHLLRAIAKLQNNDLYVPFWLDLWKGSVNPAIRAISYYGLSLSNPEIALSLLEDVIVDDDLDLTAIAWHLTTESPGLLDVSTASARLSDDQKSKFRTALEDAGADEIMLSEFDFRSNSITNDAGFKFDGLAPRDPIHARRAVTFSDRIAA